MKKFYSLLLIVLVAATSAIAGPITSAGSGNWNSTTPNAPWPGGVVPSSGDDVSIRPGDNITVTADATIGSITFLNTSTTTRTLTVDAGVTFTVTLGITVQNAVTGNTSAAIAGSGTINCASFTVGGSIVAPNLTGDGTTTFTSTIAVLAISGNLSLRGVDDGNDDNNAIFNLQSGKVSAGGTVSLTEDNGSTVTLTLASGAETGKLDISGATPFTITGSPAFTANGNNATVEYSGVAQTVRPVTYTNLTLSGSGIKTMTSVNTVDGTLTIKGTASVTAPANMTIGAVDIESGTFNGSTFSHTISGAWTNNGGTFTASTSTVTFSGTAQIGGSASTTFNNLTISGAANTVTLGVNTSIAGNLTVSDNLNLSTFSCNRTAGGGTLNVSGTMRLAGDAGGQTGSNFPTNFTTVTLGGTIEYNGSNAITQTVYATPAYTNLILTNGTGSGAAAKISTGNVTINTTFTVNANAVFTPGAANTVGGASNTITGTGKINVTRTAATASYSGQYTFSNNTLTNLSVEYSGAGNQTISTFNCANLITSNSGIKTMAASMTVSGNTTIGSGTTLDESTATLTLGTGSIVTVNGTLDFTNAGIIRTGSNMAATLTMGSSGLIKTLNAIGLGPVANASLQVQGSGSWTTSSISTNGTVEYYRSATSGQAITDRDYNNLTISGNTQVKTWTLAASRTVNGTLTISANAPFTFGAGTQTLNLKGGWMNNSTATFTPAAVIVNLNGNAAQTIGGSQETKFTALSISNAAGVSLGIGATVNGLLTLTNGIVNGGANTLTLSSTSSLAGASDASFIDGAVKKVGAIGGTAFDFPVGKTGVGYMKIGIANVTGATTEFTAQYVRASAAATFGNAGLTAIGLQAVSNCEYWTLNRTVTTSNADVTLYWNAHSGCGGSYLSDPLFGIRVAHYESSLSAWDAHGGGSPSGDASSGSVTWPGVSSFSPFALAALIGSQSGLPVMFTDVKAYEKNHGVQIEWSNLTERDLINYVVERSANGVNYTAISEQLPRSNNNDKESYSSFDALPVSGSNYYRIKVLEISGKVIYSKVIRVEIGKTTPGFAIYPNPVKGNTLSVSINNKQGQYTLKVSNASGQEVYSRKITHQGGSMTQAIELPATVKPGVYNIMISGDNYRAAKMFVVQ